MDTNCCAYRLRSGTSFCSNLGLKCLFGLSVGGDRGTGWGSDRFRNQLHRSQSPREIDGCGRVVAWIGLAMVTCD